MTAINASQIDSRRPSDSSGIGTSSSQDRTLPVSSEMQQRFERLIHAKPKDQAKANSDSKSKLVGRMSDCQHSTENDPPVSELLNDGHTQPDPCDVDTVKDHMSTSSVQTSADQALPEMESEDTSTKLKQTDYLPTERASDELDTGPATLESPSSTAALPSPLDLFSRAATNPIAVPTERATPVDNRLIDLARQVADRILVSDAVNGPREVNIQVKDAILPGTEIRLSEQAGQLQVNIVTDQKSSLDFLLQQQSALSIQLEQRLARDVVVNVDFDSLRQFSSRQQSDSNSDKHKSDQDSTNENELDAD